VSLVPLDLVSAHPWRRVAFTTYALSLSFFEAVILDALVRGGGREALTHTLYIYTRPAAVLPSLTCCGRAPRRSDRYPCVDYRGSGPRTRIVPDKRRFRKLPRPNGHIPRRGLLGTWSSFDACRRSSLAPGNPRLKRRLLRRSVPPGERFIG
jgi:hypothetical protein